MSSYVALCGGVGGAKLAYGLAQLLAAHELTVVVNTADDFDHLGLRICPDLDTVMYTLSNKANCEVGWGRAGESWEVLEELGRLGGEVWFKLGDKDLALHLLRRQLLDRGANLTAATRALAARLGVGHAVLPMTDQTVHTVVDTTEGEFPFQEYFVRRRCEPQVQGFRFVGTTRAAPSPEVVAALSDPGLRGVVICPSNPYVSVEPILAIDGIRSRLEALRVPILAVSPIVAGRALKGPAAKMMAELGGPVSGLAVARHYGKLIAGMVLDEQDRALLAERHDNDPQLFLAQTVMHTLGDRVALARECLRFLTELA